jgi:hypothetical protein
MQFLTTDKILPAGHKPANNATMLQHKCEMSLMMFPHAQPVTRYIDRRGQNNFSRSFAKNYSVPGFGN